MAAIAATQVTTVVQDGGGERFEVLRINNVTSGDTIDVSTIGAVAFKKVKQAHFMCAGDLTTQATATLGTPTTSMTLTLTGVASDTVYLSILGQA